MDDYFSSSSSSFRHEVDEEMLHRDMLYWAFSPDRLDFLHALPHPPSPQDLDVPGPPAVELPAMASLAHPPVAEEPTPLLAPESAFTKYTRPGDGLLAECSSSRPSNPRNIHHRVIQLLRRIPSAKARQESKANERNRGFRHMIRERQRREKLSQSYADLFSILSSRSKADKNSIIQSAGIYMRELKRTEEELRRRNQELRSRLIAGNEGRTEGAKISMRVANPSSAIDSMIGALRRLKTMDVKASSIHSTSSSQELSAVITIETKVATSEVGKSVEGALTEVEKQLRSKLTGSSDFRTNVTWGMCHDR